MVSASLGKTQWGLQPSPLEAKAAMSPCTSWTLRIYPCMPPCVWKRSHPWVVAQRGCWEPNFPLDVDASGSQPPAFQVCQLLTHAKWMWKFKDQNQNQKYQEILHHIEGIYTPSTQTSQKQTITLLRVIPTMTFQNCYDSFFVSLISCQVGVVRHTAYLLKCVRLLSTSQTDCRTSSDIHSDIMSGRSSDILSDISSDIIFGISPCHSVWLTFFLAILPAYLLAFFLTFSMASLLTFRLAYFLAFCLTFFRWGTTTCWTKNICGSPETAPVELVKKSYPLAN